MWVGISGNDRAARGLPSTRIRVSYRRMNFELPNRVKLFPEPNLPKGEKLMARGRAEAGVWRLGSSAFLRAQGVGSEAAYKRRMLGEARIMRHAHLGFRDLDRTVEAAARIFDNCATRGAGLDRIGMCLDWSMGFRRDQRAEQMRGTGILLETDEDFSRLTEASPAAVHFGDFMLGFPAALENTRAALAAGASAIGNLGQYFTFRLPGCDDDVECTSATVEALSLIAAQPEPVLVHSNLDDGFAAVYRDLCCALGQAIVERYIVTELIGAPYAVCYGHHFSEPLTRIAFQRALAQICGDVPGSMTYGATVLYKGNAAENFAAMSSYLLPDILAQSMKPTGHALNPVPVTENERIPDVDEIIEAQGHLDRLIELAPGYLPLLDLGQVNKVRDRLLRGGQIFAENLMSGLEAGGIDITDPFEMLLAMRRLGGRRLEMLYGPAGRAAEAKPLVPATTWKDIEAEARAFLDSAAGADLCALGQGGARLLTATTDVHEHGKMLLDKVLEGAGFSVIDGGVSTDAEVLAGIAADADAILLSTYNGVALSYARTLVAHMPMPVPVLIGGRLNQVPDASNTSLPVDVTEELTGLGIQPCVDLEAATKALRSVLGPK